MIAASSSTGTMGDVVLMPGGCWCLDQSAIGRHVSCLARILYSTAIKLCTPIGTLTVSRKNTSKQTDSLRLLYSLPVSLGKGTENVNAEGEVREVIVETNVKTIF